MFAAPCLTPTRDGLYAKLAVMFMDTSALAAS